MNKYLLFPIFVRVAISLQLDMYQNAKPSQMRKTKPRTCQHCQRSFRRHGHLQIHLRIRWPMIPQRLCCSLPVLRSTSIIYTNEQPYNCHCGASLSRTPPKHQPCPVVYGGFSPCSVTSNSKSLKHARPNDRSQAVGPWPTRRFASLV